MADQEAGLGEQILNKVAEVGIASQLQAVENLEVKIETDALKLLTGRVDAATVEGEGLVMQKQLRVDHMEIQTGQIAINPISAALGKIELTQPTTATVRVELTEEDINRSFNSEFILGKMRSIEATVDGLTEIIDVRAVDCRLPGEQRLVMRSRIYLHRQAEETEVQFTAEMHRSPDGNRILFDNVTYEGQGLPLELTAALLQRAAELATFSNFQLDGMRLQLAELDVQPGRLHLITEMVADKFPG